MDTSEILYKSVLNIALLVLMANLMLKSKIVRDSLLQEKRSLKSQVLLSAVFGGLVILSTCTAMDTGYYNINTRVIGAMAAGLLGGPVVGLYASLIGAVYAYVFSSPQVFAMAAAWVVSEVRILYRLYASEKWNHQHKHAIEYAEQIVRDFNSCPFGLFQMEAWDVYVNGVFQHTMYKTHHIV